MTITNKKLIILDTALTLFVNQGFHATSTASIAKKSGVATGTLFHHFPTKDALLNQLFLSIKQQFADEVKAQLNPKENIEQSAQQLWNVAISWGLTNPIKQKFIQQYAQSSTISQETKQQSWDTIFHFLSELIIDGQQTGLIKQHPLQLMLDNCHGQYIAATHFFLNNPEKWSDEKYKQASFMMFWGAIKSD